MNEKTSTRLTRSAVARQLGTSVSAVRRMESAGQLRPTIGPRDVRTFDPVEVAALAESRLHSARARAVPEGATETAVAPVQRSHDSAPQVGQAAGPAFSPPAPLHPTLGISQAARAASTALREAGEGAAAAKVLAEMALGEDDRARIVRDDDRRRERSRLQALGELAVEDALGCPLPDALRDRVRRRIELVFEATGAATDVLAEATGVLSRWVEEERVHAGKEQIEAARADELARLHAAIGERDEQLIARGIDRVVLKRRVEAERREREWALECERRASELAVRAVASALLTDMAFRATMANIAQLSARLGMPDTGATPPPVPVAPALTPVEQELARAVAGDLAAGRLEDVMARARQLAAAGMPPLVATRPAPRQGPLPAG